MIHLAKLFPTMGVCAKLLLCIKLCLLLSCGAGHIRDFVAVRTNLTYQIDEVIHTTELVINYSQFSRWRAICNSMAETTGMNGENLIDAVLGILQSMAYPDDVLYGEARTPAGSGDITSNQASQQLYKLSQIVPGSTAHGDHDYFIVDPPKQASPLVPQNQDTQSLDQLLFPEKYNRSSWLSSYLRTNAYDSHSIQPISVSPHKVVFYQTVGANTGGTTAMTLLHRTLLNMGFHTVICNETNRFEAMCTTPHEDSLIITGEWCHEVFAEYALNPDPNTALVPIETLHRDVIDSAGFKGRGVQYYLGFHHAQDSCRGSSAVTDCHYLSKALGCKGLSAYFLGCAMSDVIRSTVRALLQEVPEVEQVEVGERVNRQEIVGVDGVARVEEKGGTYRGVVKENLILVDADFFQDYPPFPRSLTLSPPSGFKFLLAKGFSKEVMPLLLQRAKIVLDLGMPGPERLSTEGILMGCIPIISNRWAGSSAVDFPGVHRVDHQNITSINTMLEYVANNYEKELQSMENARFYKYALSMWQKVHDTSDIVVGSSYVHLVLHAHTLDQEYEATFQILALLYLYPLCSIDLHVVDMLWFLRHHYAFFESLQQAGYVRLDPLDPAEHSLYQQDPSQSRSFVRVKTIDTLTDYIGGVSSGVHSSNVYESLLTPSWVSVLVVLPPGVAFLTPLDLLSQLTNLKYNDYGVLQYSVGDDSVGVLVAAPGCSVSSIVPSIQDMLRLSAGTTTTTTHTIHTNKSAITVCDLYNTHTVHNHTHVVYGLSNTVGWQSNKIVASSLGFSCE